jgi:cell division transport system permease protein
MVVVLTVRSGLAAQRATIATLRLAGAEDRFVAGVYQTRYLWLGLAGGIIGCALAALSMLAVDALASVGRALPALAATGQWWLGPLAVIVFVTALCVLAARLTVLRALRSGA